MQVETELVDLVGRLFWVDLGFLSPTTSLLLEAVVTLRLGPSWNRLLRLSSTAPRRRPAQNGQQVRSRAAQEKECHRSRRRCRRPRRYPTGRAAKKDARTSPTVVARQELSKMERGVLYHTILYYTILYCTPDFTRLVYVPRNSTLGPYSLPALVKPKVHLFHVFRPLYYSHKGPCSLP